MSLQRWNLELTQLSLSLQKEIGKIVHKNETKIIAMVKNRLYQYGVDGSGKEITPTYSPTTIKRKKEEGQRVSHVTLRDTGLFYSGFYLELDSKYTLILNSSSDKTSGLLDKYGEAILQFTIQEQRIIFSMIEVGIEALIAKSIRNSSSAGGSLEIDLF